MSIYTAQEEAALSRLDKRIEKAKAELLAAKEAVKCMLPPKDLNGLDSANKKLLDLLKEQLKILTRDGQITSSE